MINKENGQLELNSSITLRPFMALSNFKGLDFATSLIENDVGTGWVWYSFYNQKVGSKYFSFNCAFLKDELQELHFVFENSKVDKQENSWETWNEQEEIKKAIQFNDWLNSVIGSKREFDWGIIWAGYDPRSASSRIGIRYKK